MVYRGRSWILAIFGPPEAPRPGRAGPRGRGRAGPGPGAGGRAGRRGAEAGPKSEIVPELEHFFREMRFFNFRFTVNTAGDAFPYFVLSVFFAPANKPQAAIGNQVLPQRRGS